MYARTEHKDKQHYAQGQIHQCRPYARLIDGQQDKYRHCGIYKIHKVYIMRGVEQGQHYYGPDIVHDSQGHQKHLQSDRAARSQQ